MPECGRSTTSRATRLEFLSLTRALLVLLALSYAPVAISATASSQDAPSSSDPRIQQALAWLPTPPAVPIDTVDRDRLSKRLAREVRRACAFIVRGVPHIYVLSNCPAYRQADRNPFSAIALAAVIGHEMAHLEGADEARAREVEAELVRTLALRLPGEYRVRAAEYVASLRRRRSPVDCETHGRGIAFHTCRAEVAVLGGTAEVGGVADEVGRSEERR